MARPEVIEIPAVGVEEMGVVEIESQANPLAALHREARVRARQAARAADRGVDVEIGADRLDQINRRRQLRPVA